MAINEPAISRTLRTARGQRTGTRIQQGTIAELQAAQPIIGLKGDHPWDLALTVTETLIESEDFGAAGEPRGRLVVTYGYGDTRDRNSEERQNGWREDELDISETDIDLTHDLIGTKILIPKWNEDEEAWELIPGEITTRQTVAVWRVHLVTDTVFAHQWTEFRGYVNKEKFAEAVPDLWMFDGAKTKPLPYKDDISGKTLYDVELEFALNIPGWNTNQFGIVPEMVDKNGDQLPISNYFVAPEVNFHALFPMLNNNPDYPLIFRI